MSNDKQVSSLDENPDYNKFRVWWREQERIGLNPVVVFNHFERYFKPQWQSQQTKPTGLRMVKSSEGLPTKTVYGKVKGLLNNEEIKSAFIIPMPNGYFTFQGVGFFYTEEADYIIEWLDESGETEETKPVKDKADLIKAYEEYISLFSKCLDEAAFVFGYIVKKIDVEQGVLLRNKIEFLKSQTPKPVSEEGQCEHLALIDTGVGYHYCPACKESFKLPNGF